MAELTWKGKPDRGRGAPASGAVLPVETEEVYGSAEAEGANRLVRGDVTEVLSALAPELNNRVGLVYVDPPFATGQTFDYLATIPGAPPDASRVAVHAYEDARGLDAWLAKFADTAWLLRDLLVDGGSLYVHLDPHVAHYAKVLLDEVFGADAFQREIVWRIGWVSGFKSRARGWIRNHDTLLFYAKGGRPRVFHKEYVPYPPGYVRRDGSPPRGRGHPIDDVWNASDLDRLDSIQIISFSGEKVGYPTQKNESLLARIVRTSSDPGDLVLDCFVGSGTTAVVAEKLGRRWVASDVAPIAIHAARKRLLGLGAVRPFVVQSVGPAAGVQAPPRRLDAVAHVSGARATIEVTSFEIVQDALPPGARGAVQHWSQWLEGWSVDWDHRGGPHCADSCSWRGAARASLPLSLVHEYAVPGRYVAKVKVFDVLGGVATAPLPVDVR